MHLINKPILRVLVFSLLVACKHEADDLPMTNNPIASNCDTNDVTYSITIKQTLSIHCLRCHGSAVYTTKGSGYNFDDYGVISAQASNGSLLKSIKHQPGTVPMPVDQSAKIDDCSIRKFEIWIQAGAPNN